MENIGGSSSSSSSSSLEIANNDFKNVEPFIRIIRQPNSIYRMRYKTDTRQTNLFACDETSSNIESNDLNTEQQQQQQASHCSKMSALKTKKTFPKIEIVNCEGPAILMVCCVSSNEPYHVHPNLLVGENCSDGIAKIPIEKGSNHVEIKDIRIELVKKSQVKNNIEKLKQMKIDPFNVGYDFDQSSIDLGKLKLCFQLYFPLPEKLGNESSKSTNRPYNISPVVSNLISTSKQKLNILIQKKINLKCPANSSTDVVLFVKKLEKDQKPLVARFFDSNGWSNDVEINDIHYRCAMVFKSPPYKDENIKTEVKAKLKLYVPVESQKKRRKIDSEQTCSSSSSSQIEHNNFSSKKSKYESKSIDFIYTPSDKIEKQQPLFDDDFDNLDHVDLEMFRWTSS